MKKVVANLALILFFNIVYAQKEGNIWYFGDHAGLNFNGGSPVALTNGAMETHEGCSSISDSLGNLLFYTDGDTVWNKNHMPMPNGIGLTGNLTSTQSAMIIKKPSSQNIYYIFSLYSNYCYSSVDMSLNGGFGDVIASSKNIMIYNNINTEKQCAVRHANGNDAWIMMHSLNTFYAYRLTSGGFISTPIQTTIGIVDNNNLGQMKFSPIGNKIAFGISGGTNICLLDFDNSSGIVSNNIDITNGHSQCYGIEFSPDGSKLYTSGESSVHYIDQYDLNAGSSAAIIASRVQVANGLYNTTGLQTGPDKKVYVALVGSNYLGVIDQPDSLGLSCNYLDTAVNLGSGMCEIGLPELIADYFNPPTGINNLEGNNELSFFPNPVIDYLYVRNEVFQKSFNITMYDIAGRKILEKLITSSFQFINVSQLSNAVYVFEININDKRIIRKIVKE